MKFLVLVAGLVLVAAGIGGLALDPVLVRTGNSLLDWRLTFERCEPTHDAYYVVALDEMVFAALLLVGATALICHFTRAA